MIIKNRSPLFKRGTILDREILEYLRNDAREYFDMKYLKSSSGIIEGFDVIVQDEIIHIEPGIFKWKDKTYKLTEFLKINIPEIDGDYYLKIKFYEEEEKGKFLCNYFEVILSDKQLEKTELEIARIKKREGAQIRNYEKYQGIDKEYNQINIINQIQSTKTGTSLNYKILKLFSQEMLNEKETTELDKIVCFMMLEEKFERESLNKYLEEKLNIETETLSSEDIYSMLEKILRNTRNKKNSIKNSFKSTNKIMVE